MNNGQRRGITTIVINENEQRKNKKNSCYEE
jgi:hypothetical protein